MTMSRARRKVVAANGSQFDEPQLWDHERRDASAVGVAAVMYLYGASNIDYGFELQSGFYGAQASVVMAELYESEATVI